MKKYVMLLVVGIAFMASCQTANADCGKMWIYPYSWGGGYDFQPLPQPLGGTSNTAPTDYQNNMTQNVNVNVTTNNEEIERLRQQLDRIEDLIRQLLESRDQSPTDPPPTEDPPLPPEDPPVNGTGNVLAGDGGLVPPPDEGSNVGDGSVCGVFHESAQQAVIAWNGYADNRGKETIVLTTDEVTSSQRSGVLLSVMPLPGAPISVKEANIKTFVEAKTLFRSKKKIGYPDGACCGVVMTKKIGAHNIFVWELDSVESFQRDVQSWVAQKYNKQAAALITKDTVRTLSYYFQKGFRYFAFDLTVVDGVNKTKAAIAYTFQSTHVYYPLVISRVGGESTNSTVDLIVMTPGDIRLTGAITKIITSGKRPDINQGEATLVGGGNAVFTIDEVRKLEPKLAEVFDSGTREVKVRNIRFTGKLNGFKKDFTANAVQR